MAFFARKTNQARLTFATFLAEEDYNAFCLAYMFTYRDFEGGTLGLAWTGDLKNAGGVCEKNGVSLASLFFVVTSQYVIDIGLDR